jgi:hypothetical protein
MGMLVLMEMECMYENEGRELVKRKMENVGLCP